MNIKPFAWTALWIVHLFVCLPVKSYPLNLKDSNINLMRADVKCLPDSKFYTPSNVKDECIPAALECFMTELKGEVLSNECDDSEYVVGLGVDFLTRVKSHLLKAKSHATTTASKCHCESWPETSFSNFLDELESLLQRINSEASI